MKTHEKIKIVEMTPEETEAILERIEKGALEGKDYERIADLVRSYVNLTLLLKKKKLSMSCLQALLFGMKTEKTSKVLEKAGEEVAKADDKDGAEGAGIESGPGQENKPRKGHGRNGADAHTGAERVKIDHETLKPGDPCPQCKNGKLYKLAKPAVLVRFVGQAPIGATVYEQQRLRCTPCGAVFTAKPPEGVGARKYDETAPSMIALLKYGSGLPYNRLEGLQRDLGILLPASTQWDIVKEADGPVAPAHEELIRQAAQGEVVYNDDTPMKILSLMKERGEQEAQGEDAYPVPSDAPKRKGIFTSGIVSTTGERKIVLFFTGCKHAGEV